MEDKCKICGQLKKLSYEHVPPKQAFNSWKQKTYSGDELIKHIQSDNLPWDVVNIKGKELQRGVGHYTLCERCNNFTGTKYASAFIDFSNQALEAIVIQKKNFGTIDIKFKGIKPLNIIKQIMSMLVSINNSNFTDTNPKLRQFILEKENRLKFTDIQVYAYVNMGVVLRSIGITPIFKEGTFRTVSELTTIPIGYVMEIEPKMVEKLLVNISHFSEFNYDEVIDLGIEFPILQSNSYLPLDYRLRGEFPRFNASNPNL